jgi:AcrR family transcriptional regulator
MIQVGRPPKKARPRRKSTERRRRKILSAALSCFLANGIAGTTINQIKAASHSSQGSIYHLFEGKDEIASTLFLEGMQLYQQQLIAALERETTARGSVRAVVTSHLKSVHDAPQRALFLTRVGIGDESARIAEQYQAMTSEFEQLAWKYLQPYVGRNEIARYSPELYFPLMIGPAAYASRAWLMGGCATDLLALTDEIADAAWKTLRGDERKERWGNQR